MAHRVAAIAVEDESIFFTEAMIEALETSASAKIRPPVTILRADVLMLKNTDNPYRYYEDVVVKTVRRLIEGAAASGPPIEAIGLSIGGMYDSKSGVVTNLLRSETTTRLSSINFAAELKGAAPGARIVVDNDASAAALGEAYWGVGQGHDCFAFVRAGRGINGGLIVDGRPWAGRLHPEFGHYIPARHPDDTEFEGVCPIHNHCLQGLVSARALNAEGRFAEGKRDEVAGFYLAKICTMLALTVAPFRIALGGTTITPAVLDETRKAFTNEIKTFPAYAAAADVYLMAGKLGDQAAMMGCVELARLALLDAAVAQATRRQG